MHFDFRVEFFPFVAKFMKTLEESRNDLNIVWTWGPFIVVSLRSFFIREEPTPYFPPPFLFFGLASPKDRSAVTGLNAKHRNMHANWRRPSSPIVSLPFLPSFLSFFFFYFYFWQCEANSPRFFSPFFQIVNRLVSREEKTRICDNEVATDRPKNLIPRLVYRCISLVYTR